LGGPVVPLVSIRTATPGRPTSSEHGIGPMADGTPRYGEQPSAQPVAAAGAVRRLTGLLLSLEHEHPTVNAMLAQFAQWEGELATAVPPDPTPRIGEGGAKQRVYLDHACDVGAHNPCFPRVHLRSSRRRDRFWPRHL